MRAKIDGIQTELHWESDQLIHELIIEDQKFLRRVVYSFLASEDEERIVHVTINGTSLSWTNEVEVICDPWRLNFANKTIITNILKLLQKRSVDERNYLATQEIKSQVSQYLVDLIEQEQFSFELVFDDVELPSLAKAVSLRPEKDESDLVQSLLTYTEIMSEIGKMELLVLVNIHNLYTSSEIEQIYDYLIHKEIKTLVIENYVCPTVADTQRLIIDPQGCEI